MIAIEHPLNIDSLFLTWQPKGNKVRFCIAEISRLNDSYQFEYLVDSIDYKDAIEIGFKGFPSFKIDQRLHSEDSLSSFMKRLPPKSRSDFSKYLNRHGLSEDLNLNEFNILAHTGAQLPSDGFALIPRLEHATVPFDYIMEIAGSRHHIKTSDLDEIHVNTKAKFEIEPSNCHDENAVAITYNSKKIGYVNKVLCSSMKMLLESRNVEGVIARKSGTNDRPLIYILIRVR